MSARQDLDETSRRHVRIWPVGLVGRICVVLLAAVGMVFLASAAFYEEAETYIDDDARVAQLVEMLSTDLRVMETTPLPRQPVMAELLSGREMALHWRPAGQEVRRETTPSLERLRAEMVEFDPAFGRADLRIYELPGAATSIRGSLLLGDDGELDFTAGEVIGRRHVKSGLASAAVAAVAVGVIAAILIRALSTPLRALSTVADGVGAESKWVALDERGPREVRDLARAINGMQDRIARLINDRTQALAAVSHDLRTPLARLRLRAGFLADTEAQRAIEADVEEMEAMVTGVLAYLAGDLDPEPERAMDLVATLLTLLESQSDRGRETSYDGPDRCPIRARPLTTKRVFANLIDNACHYGGDVHVALRLAGAVVTVMIDDSGPGIPEGEHERVLAPFYRLEASRSRATGGMGLGLAIVRQEVERAGGQVRLGRAARGGLRVVVMLPLGGRPSSG